MKLSEAIEIIQDLVNNAPSQADPDWLDAVNLAMGCLKFRLAMKDKWGFSAYDRLPGEDYELDTVRTP